MTQQPFSRPGAIDLSGLGQPTVPPAPPATGASAAVGSSYSVVVDSEQSLQTVVEASMTAPVILLFIAPSRVPESAQMAIDLADAVAQHEGRFLAAVADVEALPTIAQMMQIQQVPLMMVLVDGRPATQPIPGIASLEELQAMFTQLGQQLTTQGIAGRHQPRSAAEPAGEGEDEVVDPRYAPAQDALASGDLDGAVAEYQKLVDANPADVEAVGGLAIAKVMQRTQGVDLAQARSAAAEHPDDVDAQTMVADLDMLGGHVEDAFTRLVNLIARTVDPEKSKAREHLLGLFAAVGNDDPRVLAGRRNLASALF